MRRKKDAPSIRASSLFSLIVFSQGHAQPVSLWSTSANPVTITDPDTNSVELGVKFSSSVSGTVSAIRFYKGPLNTGAHTVSLWSSSGPRLAQATATNETAGGWQTVPLSPPIVIQAGTTYVASYHAPNGHYADDQNYFPYKSGVLSAPLNAGVYSYGASSTFPNNTLYDINYWVDVVFSPVVLSPPIAASIRSTTDQAAQRGPIRKRRFRLPPSRLQGRRVPVTKPQPGAALFRRRAPQA